MEGISTEKIGMRGENLGDQDGPVSCVQRGRKANTLNQQLNSKHNGKYDNLVELSSLADLFDKAAKTSSRAPSICLRKVSRGPGATDL